LERESFQGFLRSGFRVVSGIVRRRSARDHANDQGAGGIEAGCHLPAGFDRQSDDRHQRRELQAVAKRHGWTVAPEHIFEDNGISGAKGRKDRPALDAMLKGVARRDFDMVAAWSVDRLGRSLQDLIEVLSDLHAKGVDLYLHQQGLDTSTPSGRAMYQMMGVFAEFERAIIRERVLSGIARAKAEGTKRAYVPSPANFGRASGQCCGLRPRWRHE
jgi:DNA invertase Pin-like site-specific DNA recombinase